MSKIVRPVWAVAVAATLCAPPGAMAAESASAACSVTVDYLRNSVLGEAYRRDFVVTQGVAFVDDLSTATRSRRFAAALNRSGGETVVSIDYFSDVGVFVAVGFDAALTLHGGGAPESTAGGHTTFVSSGVTPQVVGGNHTTRYTLLCRRI